MLLSGRPIRPGVRRRPPSARALSGTIGPRLQRASLPDPKTNCRAWGPASSADRCSQCRSAIRGQSALNLQFIGEAGSKRFLTGGRVKGCCSLIGEPGDVVCIAEGFATGASVHEATGHAVAFAFDCGNLQSVAKAMRALFPNVQIVIAADDDYHTAGNPGLTKARKAAAAIGGLIAVPDFGADRPEDAKDFNDLAAHRGA